MLVPCCLLLLTALAAPADRVADGDFERPDLTLAVGAEAVGWSILAPAEERGTLSIADGAGRGGSRAAAYRRAAEGSANIHLDQILTVAPDTFYEVSAWIRGDGNVQPLLLVANLDWKPLATVVVPASDDWQRVQLVFNSYQLERVRLQWYPGAEGRMYSGIAGRGFLDDVSVRPIDDVAPELRRALELSRPRAGDRIDRSRATPGPVGDPRPLRPIVCHDGVLRYADGAEVALWGLNIQTPLSWEWRSRLERIGVPLEADALKALTDENLDHFAPLGATVLRAHLLPSDFTDREGNLVDTVFLDVLDHLMAAAEQRGIYVYLTLINEMSSVHLPDSFIAGRERATWIYDDAFIGRAETYVRALLTHRNRYTGRVFHEEPALALIELVNEPAYPQREELSTNEALAAAYDGWLAERGLTGPRDTLFASWRYERTRAFIDRLCAAIRASGARQPTVWNLNWPRKINGHEDAFQAAADSAVDAVSFCLYPGQSDVKSPYWANPEDLSGRNYLPWLAEHDADYSRLGWILGERFAGKAKCVYEFETFYNQSSYLYPAMARLFRSLGVQVAPMWEYTLSPAAEHHSGSHYLNLDCTPAKAAGFRVAAQVFASTPRLRPFEPTSETRLAEPTWLADFERDLALWASPEALLHSGDVDGELLPIHDRVRTVVGRGRSPLAEYGGSGIYLLSIGDDAIELTLRPDATFVREPWQRPPRDAAKTCLLETDVAHPFVLNLPGWEDARVERVGEGPVKTERPGLRFRARPGRYRIVKQP